jgi:hypothetical protein
MRLFALIDEQRRRGPDGDGDDGAAGSLVPLS